MEKKKRRLLRLFILLFSVSVSVTALPGSLVNVYGLFGEITASFVTEDQDSEIVEERQVYKPVKQVRGINIYNVWFEVWICIICLIYTAYKLRLPGADTIVSQKVRMDN